MKTYYAHVVEICEAGYRTVSLADRTDLHELRLFVQAHLQGFSRAEAIKAIECGFSHIAIIAGCADCAPTYSDDIVRESFLEIDFQDVGVI